MLESFTWNFFEKTGNIEAYIEYINIRDCSFYSGGASYDKQELDSKRTDN